MEYFAGIDVSLEQSSVCVVDAAGADELCGDQPDDAPRHASLAPRRLKPMNIRTFPVDLPVSRFVHQRLDALIAQTALAQARALLARVQAQVLTSAAALAFATGTLVSSDGPGIEKPPPAARRDRAAG